ncbi:polysaccharide deacetylase family protein [Arthrobacter sp. Z4-13]
MSIFSRSPESLPSDVWAYQSSVPQFRTPLGRRGFFRVGAVSSALTGAWIAARPDISAANAQELAAVETGLYEASQMGLDGSFGSVGSGPSGLHYPVAVEWISTFQPGHRFQVSNATAKDDPANPAFGSQSLSLVASGPGVHAQITKTGLKLNTTLKHFVVWVRFEDFGNQSDATFLQGNKLGAIELLLGTPGFGRYYTLRTWISGESITPAINGEWFPLRFDWASYSTLETNSPPRDGLTDLRLRFIASANVSDSEKLVLNVGGIGLVPVAAHKYPHGVVSFTFDDCYVDAYSEGKRILDKYGYPGTAYVISDLFGQPGRLTIEQASAMQDLSNWEIGGHSMGRVAHDARLSNLDAATLDAELSAHKAWLRSHGFRGQSFAYPQGAFNRETIHMVRRYFSSARTTSSQPLHNHPERLDPYLLTHCDASVAGISAPVMQRLDEAKANHSWLILTHHRIHPSVGLSPTEFEKIVDHAASIGIAVRTVEDVVAGR